ncbi:hypothetical protein WCE41_04555 [Luteimonas sp. MJ246]|uniref:hypothetical protein n=1 Tax=Luteimonas sp. MJ174 TaxID=3129237 RepID=UPI0031BACC93
MQAILESVPMPAGRPAYARRHRIAGMEPLGRGLERFQAVARVLAAQGGEAPTLDGVASAARSLSQAYAGHAWAPCIHQRRHGLQALQTLAHDPAWRLATEQVECIALLADYARGRDRLVPDAVPVIGGLDIAVLFDLAWPGLVADAEAYLDFRRLRVEEALLRGQRRDSFDFSRDQWLEARRAEMALRVHVAMRGTRSYLSTASAPVFRIH